MSAKRIVKKMIYGFSMVFIRVTNRVFSDGASFKFPLLANAHPFILLVKNLIRPARLYKKFRYGQLGPLSRITSKADAVPEDVIAQAQQAGGFDQYVETLRQDGVLIIDGHFKDLADKISDSVYFNPPSNSEEPYDYEQLTICPFADQSVFEVVSDPLLLGILSKYLHSQPYLRSTTNICWTSPRVEQEFAEKIYCEDMKELAAARRNNSYVAGAPKGKPRLTRNTLWHYDTVNNLTIRVLLGNNERTESHLKYALKSHRHHHVQTVPIVDYEYSEDYIERHFQTIDCVGSPGTLMILDTNGIHRLHAVPGKGRLELAWCVGPGNNTDFQKSAPVGFGKEPVSPPTNTEKAMKGQMHFFRKYPGNPNKPFCETVAPSADQISGN